MKIEGRNAVRELLNSTKPIDKVYISQTRDNILNQLFILCKQRKVKVIVCNNDVLNKESVTKKHQGIIAVTDDYSYVSTDDILDYARQKNENPFIAILDGIEDPQNLGSIVRVCECLGVHGIIIPKNRSCMVTETVVRVSMGATNHIKIAKVTNLNTEIKHLKDKGVWIYGCELGGEDIRKAKLTGSIAIVIGSEGKGISKLTKEMCDSIITIPMKGKVNSLNASVASGICLWEVAKNR